jgi:uncharacterized protein YegP (UPF0339 family)
MKNIQSKPGIHLYKDLAIFIDGRKPYYYWHTRAKNGRITANGETYSRKSNALKSIRSTSITLGGKGKFKYYDHSKPDSPLISYV